MVNKIIEFCLENYRLIIDCLAIVISIVFFLVRKKPVNSIVEAIDHAALIAIHEAELTELKGKAKLQYAIDSVCRWLCEKYPKLDFKRYIPLIENTIEIILTTPQKKGEKDGK